MPNSSDTSAKVPAAQPPDRNAGDLFLTTRWSVVRRAVEGEGPSAHEAMTQLCAASWYPLYAFIRRSGKGAHDAEDLTQGFFERLLEKNFFAAADRERGRLRAFLLTCVKRYLADQHDRAMAAKRGGGKVITFSAATAEQLYAAEPVDELTPDRLFQRRWALNLIDAAMAALREKYTADGKGDLFGALSPFLGFGASGEENYQAAADALGMKLNTVKSHIRRLREHWRELLMQRVANTLDEPTPENIRSEMMELIGLV